MDIFLYIVTGLTFLTLLAVFFNYWRSKAQIYLHFALSLIFALASFGILIWLDIGQLGSFDLYGNFAAQNDINVNMNVTGSNGVAQQLNANSSVMQAVLQLVISADLSTVALMLFDLAVLKLLSVWTASLYGILPQNKHQRGLSASSTLRWLYIISALIMVVCLPLFMYVSVYIGLGYLVGSLIYNLGSLYGLAIVIWLVLDIRRTPGAPMSLKRRQGVIILLFMLFSGGYLYSYGYGWQVYSGISWLTRCFILVWPGLLNGFEVAPAGGPLQAAPGGALVAANPPSYAEKV